MLPINKYKVLISKKKWRQYSNNKKKIFFIGFFYNYSDLEVIEKVSFASEDNLKKTLEKIDGNFSIIVQGKNYLLVAVDRISSYPLLYTIKKNKLFISDNGIILKNELNLCRDSVDYSVSSTFAMSGYTSHNDTIYKSLKTLYPGEYLHFKKNKAKFELFFQWRPWLNSNSFKKEYLSKLNEKIIKKLIKSCKGKQLIVPLSAGWDSRLIASGLKHFGYKNVLCVTYGRKGSNDAIIANKISKKLDFKWLHIEYTKAKVRRVYKSKDYQNYKKYCDNLNSIYFMGEYLMLSELKGNQLVEKNAVIVNGQTGDFISGNHIPSKINNKSSSINLLLNEYIQKHNKYWNALMTVERTNLVKTQLNKQIDFILGKKKHKEISLFRLYEALEFYNRQVKYVINGVRNYEYFDFDWRMPLWDKEYIKFWETAPYYLKKNQNFYKKSLLKSNWANVWTHIQINPKNKFTWYMSLLRFLSKIFFLTLGKNKWHRFEKKYIEYFTENFHNYSPWSYLKVFSDQREHFSAISWYIADYLERKKIRWDGKKR